MEKTPKINAEGEVQMGLISQTAEPSSATGVSSSIYKYSAHLEEKKNQHINTLMDYFFCMEMLLQCNFPSVFKMTAYISFF